VYAFHLILQSCTYVDLEVTESKENQEWWSSKGHNMCFLVNQGFALSNTESGMCTRKKYEEIPSTELYFFTELNLFNFHF
jgi:hypothetical protein